jgi:hypothetical protein
MDIDSGLVAVLTVCMCTAASAATAELKTYTSPDRKFQFEYSSTLTVCMRQRAPGGLLWGPEDCQDMAEPCGIERSSLKTTVCLAFPKRELKHYPVVSAGTFSVAEVTDRASERTCLDLSEYLFDGLATDRVRIHDTTYLHVDRGYVGGSHGEDRSIFRAYHDGACYQIEVTIATAVGRVDLKPNDITAYLTEDNLLVERRLKQAVDSFRFLK